MNQLYSQIMDRRPEEQIVLYTKYYTTYPITTEQKQYTLINVPGNIHYFNETIKGISHTDIAIIVLSAVKYEYDTGFLQRGTTHSQLSLCSAMGIKKMVCVINKMDIVLYKEDCYQEIVQQFYKNLIEQGYTPEKIDFIPVSNVFSQNIVKKHYTMEWYKGPTLLETLDNYSPYIKGNLEDRPLRIKIHNSFQINGIDSIVLGKVVYGQIKPGQIVKFAPSAIEGKVCEIQTHNIQLEKGTPGQMIGFTVKNINHKQIKNGFICSDANHDPGQDCIYFIANIKLMKDFSFQIKVGSSYIICVNTTKIQCKIETLISKVNQNNQEQIIDSPSELVAKDQALVKFTPKKSLCIECYSDFPQLGTIALLDNSYVISTGIIQVEKKMILKQLQQ